MSANGHNGHLEPVRLAALASALLLIDDAKIYGLIDGGPEVDRGRCDEILAGLKREGVVPSQDEISAAALDLMVELGAIRP